LPIEIALPLTSPSSGTYLNDYEGDLLGEGLLDELFWLFVVTVILLESVTAG
jgi:hypothetical protein